MPSEIHRFRGGGTLRGTVTLPGDKSISHRALMLAAIAEGESRLGGLSSAEDVKRTVTALRALGVSIEESGGQVIVTGVGLDGLRAPNGPIECGNSGTTLRLLAGLLAGRPFAAELRGDSSLSARPMGRIVEPLRRMGAVIEGASGPEGEILAPLRLEGGTLRGVPSELAVASAQAKTALLLAGLRARGVTCVTEPGASRDHTERLLRRAGAPVEAAPGYAALDTGGWDGRLAPISWSIPGDLSSAAFLCVGATLLVGGDVLFRGVGLNPTRTGFLEVLAHMGAVARVESVEEDIEPRGDLRVTSSTLEATEVGGSLALRSLDEIPVLVVAATRAMGRTTFADLGELRVKESDRIAAMASLLTQMGADVEELPEGLAVRGPMRLRGARLAVDPEHRDHRVLMALAIAALCAEGTTELDGLHAADVSFPAFVPTLRALGAQLTTVDAP